MSHAVLALAITIAAVAIGLSGAARSRERSILIACGVAALAVVLHIAEVLLT